MESLCYDSKHQRVSEGSGFLILTELVCILLMSPDCVYFGFALYQDVYVTHICLLLSFVFKPVLCINTYSLWIVVYVTVWFYAYLVRSYRLLLFAYNWVCQLVRSAAPWLFTLWDFIDIYLNSYLRTEYQCGLVHFYHDWSLCIRIHNVLPFKFKRLHHNFLHLRFTYFFIIQELMLFL